DELRQLATPRRLQLARVLAQLGRNRLVAEELVDGVLVRALEHIARLHVRDAVLRDRKAPSHGLLPHRNVVVLGSGEVLEQVAERLRWDDAEVEAKTVARDDRRLRVSLRDDLDDPFEAGEVRSQLGGLRRARDD